MKSWIIPAPPLSRSLCDLDRFEWTAPDRLEVAGRWFGVRGLRFMRPTLELHGTDDHQRLLALLEHKPWAAEDGDEWIAAFPYVGGPEDFADAQLTGTPSLAGDLPPP